MSRSRSSTVSSAYRSPVPSTDQPLHSDHVAGSSSSSSPPPSTTTMMGPRSYASEHSLHTLRGPKYMIDLPTSRSRSDTFGGVELPSDAQLRRDDDRSDSDGDDDDDDKRAGTPLTRQRTSSVSSLRSLDPALHLGGAPLKERRPVLYAGLQAGALLLASILGLYLTLKLALPPIDPEHKDKVKLPKSFDDLKELNEVLQVRRSFDAAYSVGMADCSSAARSTRNETTTASWDAGSPCTSCELRVCLRLSDSSRSRFPWWRSRESLLHTSRTGVAPEPYADSYGHPPARSLQAFSVPGSMYLSILGGALWGVLIALPLVCFVSLRLIGPISRHVETHLARATRSLSPPAPSCATSCRPHSGRPSCRTAKFGSVASIGGPNGSRSTTRT